MPETYAIPIILLLITALLSLIAFGGRSYIIHQKEQGAEFRGRLIKNDRDHSTLLMGIKESSLQIEHHDEKITIHGNKINQHDKEINSIIHHIHKK
jgi:hypothetical protein